MYLDWLEKGLEKPGKTRRGLAAHMGRHASQVTRMLKEGGRHIKAHELRMIADYIEEPVPANGALRPSIVGSFDPDAPERPEDPDAPPDLTAFPKDAIKELATKAGLGNGQVISTTYRRGEDDIVSQDPIRDDYWHLPSHVVRDELGSSVLNLLVVQCEGDSMEPTIFAKDRVIIDTSHKKLSPDGLYAIRNRYEDIVVKRLTLKANDRVDVVSDNLKHAKEERGLDEIAIVGKVVLGLKLF